MKSKQQGLSNQVKMWPTPDANMNRGTQKNFRPIRPSGQHATYSLNQAVQDSLMPTPQTQGLKECVNGQSIPLIPTGKLNPQWVEWLMGLPIGYTDLKCSETAKSLLARMLLE